MTWVLIFTVIIFILVMCLSFFTINKGYAYKHTIDERPKEADEKGSDQKVEEGNC